MTQIKLKLDNVCSYMYLLIFNINIFYMDQLKYAC